jgi:hypothetical protein
MRLDGPRSGLLQTFAWRAGSRVKKHCDMLYIRVVAVWMSR